MKRRLSWLGMTGLLCGVAGALVGAHAASAQTVAIVGGTVALGDGSEPIANGTVIIRNGRVVAAGSQAAVPAGAEVIDASGKWVTPGLVAGFSRLGLSDVEYEILIDVALGLTDKAIAHRKHLSLRSVQNRLQQLYEKLDVYESCGRNHEGSEGWFNLRMRAVAVALQRKVLNTSALERAERDLQASGRM